MFDARTSRFNVPSVLLVHNLNMWYNATRRLSMSASISIRMIPSPSLLGDSAYTAGALPLLACGQFTPEYCENNEAGSCRAVAFGGLRFSLF